MSDRDREIERLTEVFKDAILHAPIPDVNPNLIRTVESQARECALRVVGEDLNKQERGPLPPCEHGVPRHYGCLQCLRDACDCAPSSRPDTTADAEAGCRKMEDGRPCDLCHHENCGWCGECHPEVPEW